ncbi:MAG: hypothetical protein WDW38_006259 [Sanguina aurantia]
MGGVRRPAASPQTPSITAEISKLSVSLPSNEVLRTIRWELMADGRTGQALVVCEVLEGSDAEQQGVRRGLRLVEISDTMRPDTMWPLQDRPSPRFIRDALKMRRSMPSSLVFAPFKDASDMMTQSLESDSEGAVIMPLVAPSSRFNGSSSSSSSSRDRDSAESSPTSSGSRGDGIPVGSVSDGEGGLLGVILPPAAPGMTIGERGASLLLSSLPALAWAWSGVAGCSARASVSRHTLSGAPPVESDPRVAAPNTNTPHAAPHGRVHAAPVVLRCAGDILAAQYEASEKADAELSAVQKRVQARASYMGVVGKRNDWGLGAILFCSFVLPAAVILAIAYFSGYLDTMYVNSLSPQ